MDDLTGRRRIWNPRPNAFRAFRLRGGLAAVADRALGPQSEATRQRAFGPTGPPVIRPATIQTSRKDVPTLADAVEDFLLAKWPDQKPNICLRQYRSWLRQFVHTIPRRELAGYEFDCAIGDVQLYLAECQREGNKAGTINAKRIMASSWVTMTRANSPCPPLRGARGLTWSRQGGQDNVFQTLHPTISEA